MLSMLAIVSKAVFEKQAKGLALGDVWGTDTYTSGNKAFHALDGGDLYLVTVRPPEDLWLVAKLVAPAFHDGAWKTGANRVAARNIDDLRDKLVFATGAGLHAKPGQLGMSLQAPRALTDADVALLDGANAATPRSTLGEAAGSAGDLPSLANMIASLRANQPGAALVHAIAAWRALPAPAIAELVEALDKRIAPVLAPIEGNTKDATQRAWLDLAAKRRPIDLARLLPTLGAAALPSIRARFAQLGAFAPDPRLAAAMLPLPGEYSYEAGPSFVMAFEIAEASRDPRVKKLLDAVIEQLGAKRGSTAWNEYVAKHTRRAAKIRDALPTKIEVPAAVANQIAACKAALGALRGTADEATLIAQSTSIASGAPDPRLALLLADVLEHPADDHARAVYADALADAGDPRGEFIQLQLRGKAPNAREKELVKQHAREWTAPLDAVLSQVGFERGFLASGVVEWKTDAQRAALRDHPLWSTLRELDADQEFLLSPTLRDLRRANTEAPTLAKLAERARPVPLEAAHGATRMSYGIRGRFGIDVGTRAQWGAALDVGALVHLKSLSICATDDERDLVPAKLGWLLDSKLGRQLTALELHGLRRTFVVAAWTKWLAERGSTRASSITVRGSFSNGNTASGSRNPRVVIDLVPSGAKVDVALGFNDEMSDLRHLSISVQIDQALAGLPSPHVGKVRVEYIGSKKRIERGYPAIADRLRAAFPDIALD